MGTINANCRAEWQDDFGHAVFMVEGPDGQLHNTHCDELDRFYPEDDVDVELGQDSMGTYALVHHRGNGYRYELRFDGPDGWRVATSSWVG